MNLDYIREFLVFSKSMNYTTAAKKLYLAQPTLIKHMNKLESELGFSLVTHDRNPKLTEAGALFRIDMIRNMQAFDDSITRCLEKSNRSASRIRIVNDQSCFEPGFFDFMSSQHAEQTRMAFIDVDRSCSEFEVLDKDAVDFSITVPANEDRSLYDDMSADLYGSIRLRPFSCTVFLSYLHPLSRLDEIPLEALSGYGLLAVTDRFYRRNGRSMHQSLEARNVKTTLMETPYETLFSVLESSASAFCLMPERTWELMSYVKRSDDIVKIPLADPGFEIHPHVVYRKDNPNPLVHEFAEKWRAFLNDAPE